MFMTLLQYAPLFASGASSCKHNFLGLVPWFGYFPSSWFGGSGYGACDINNNFRFLPSDGHSGLLLILLAVADDLIRITALVSVGYVIYGGIAYTTSQGSPDQTKKARQTIINALIGLALAIMAVSIVALVGKRLGS